VSKQIKRIAEMAPNEAMQRTRELAL
jgi:hypothetical protein